MKELKMCIAILLQSKKESKLVHWAARLASARGVPLMLVWAQHRRGGSKIEECTDLDSVPAELAGCCEDLAGNGFCYPPDSSANSESDSGSAKPALHVFNVYSENVPRDVRSLLEEKKPTCLVIPRDADLRPGSPESAPLDYLMSHLPCEMILLTAGSRESGTCREILTPVGEGPHSVSCLRLAHDLVSTGTANLVALHVEPEIDETAKLAALRILSGTVERAFGTAPDNVHQRVELTRNVVKGIERAVGDSTDLIVVGIKRSGFSRRFNAGGIAGKLTEAELGPTIAIVQSALPISSRFGRKCDELLRDWVPQLARDMRVDLVERVQRSSRWDFDFILLICLSTIIAAGGLIQDSAAVVIGAMLVAPLMTPLLGAGLAMVQGNPVLFRDTLYTVLRGFLVAYAVAILVAIVAGWFVPVHLTDELRARGEPTPLDILVAMVGGIAAAYASGRPNLLSALPGVAIAAALVPPIATSGISLWLGDFGLAFRSALLFVTNIVAIILGTALAFRATGIRGVHQHGTFDRWSLLAGAVVVLLTISLGVFEAMPLTEEGRPIRELVNELSEQDAWHCTSTEWKIIDGQRWLTVRLTSPTAMTQEQLDGIRSAIREGKTGPTKVRFVTETLDDP